MTLGKGLESLIPQKNPPVVQPDDKQVQQSNSFNNQQKNDANQQSPIAIQEPPKNNQNELKAHTESQSQLSQPKEHQVKPNYLKHHQVQSKEAIFLIETEHIKPNPFQPRKNFDEESLRELAASIREFGIIQPIVVSKIEKETDSGTSVEYQLIAGERRLMASKLVGLERIPAIIRKISNKSEQLEIAVIENLQRADLNPIETARSYAKLQDEFGLTQREIASRLGKSREVIANALRLLNLPTEIQDAVSNGQINESQGRLLLVIEDLAEQKKVFEEIINNNLSVRELRSRLRKSPLPDSLAEKQENKFQSTDPEIIDLQEQLIELLGAEVKIEKTDKNGKIIITFYSPEEIRGIIDKLNPKQGLINNS